MTRIEAVRTLGTSRGQTGASILIAGAIEGRVGIWSVGRDGSDLQLVALLDALDLAVDEDGQQVAAILAAGAGTTSPIVVLRWPPRRA